MKKNLIPHSIFLSLPVYLAINIGLIVLDWFVLYSLFATFSNDNEETIYSGALVLAIAIDATVMLIGHICGERLRNSTLSRICVVFLILAFGTAATAMGCMRLMNSDAISDSAPVVSSDGSIDYFASSPADDTEPEADKSGADDRVKRLNLFTQILFTLSPIFTSVVAFCLSCLRGQYKLRLDIQKKEREIEELNAEALAIKNAMLMNETEAQDDGKRLVSLNNCLSEVDNLNQSLKEKVREIYMSFWNIPEHIHYAQNIAVTASPLYYPSRLAALPEKPPAPVFPADVPDREESDAEAPEEREEGYEDDE